MPEIVFRLVGGKLDGQWRIFPGFDRIFLQVTVAEPPYWDYRDIYLVATGSVEWEGDRCAEVWVPEDKLEYYIAEFQDQDEELR